MGSDISLRTTVRADRDQVIRNIDVGSYYAGVRDFFFSLLVRNPQSAPLGAAAVQSYSDLEQTRALLAKHRPDGLANLRAVTLFTWQDIAKVLRTAEAAARREHERNYAQRALHWMSDNRV